MANWNNCIYCGILYDLDDYETLDDYCPDCQDKLFSPDHD